MGASVGRNRPWRLLVYFQAPFEVISEYVYVDHDVRCVKGLLVQQTCTSKWALTNLEYSWIIIIMVLRRSALPNIVDSKMQETFRVQVGVRT